MTASYDFSNGTFGGSVFAGCAFNAAPPPWAVEAGRLAETERRFAAMPEVEVPLPGELPPGSWLPHAPNPNFVGREGELRAVAVALRGAGAAALCPPVGLQGLGGVGKTQLAVEFASRYGRWFAGGVFWLECAEPASIDAQVARLGAEAALEMPERFAAMPLAEQCATVWRLWRSGIPRLLVFDNCEDDALLGALRPKQGGCRVLVTSRRSEWSVAHGLRPVRVEALPRAESVLLLAGFRPDLAERAELDAIAEELGDLPLALHLAGSFLRENRFDVEGEPGQYLAALRAGGLDHASLIGALGASGVMDALPTGHDRHVARTFALSWDRLDPAAPADALARQVMACAAWFAPRVPIPRDLLAQASRALGGDEAASVGAALMRLLALGLVVEEPGGGVSLHRLVSAFAAARTGDPVAAHNACGIVLRAVLSEANRTGLPARSAPLLPHVEHLLGTDRAERAGSWIAYLLNDLGYAYQTLAAYGAARTRYAQALAIYKATLGPSHPNVATSLSNVAGVLLAQGDLTGAQQLYAQALAISEAALGPNDTQVAVGLNNLAETLRAQGEHAEARPIFERALAIYKAALSPGCLDTAKTLNNLADLVLMQRDLEGAKKLIEQALAISSVMFASDHPIIARSLGSLAGVLRAGGDLVTAKESIERALAIYEAAFGPNHPDIARELNNLANILCDQGDYAGARKRLERALGILTHAFGPEHHRTRLVRDNLAELSASGRPGSPRNGSVGSSESVLVQSQASAGSPAPAAARAPSGTSCVMSEAPVARPLPRTEETLMAETPPSGGAKYDFKGVTIHGSVFADAVFHEAVSLTHGLGAQPSQQADLAKALETLRAQLAAVPDDKRPLADKAAESAKEVVAAAKPGGDESLFRGAVRSLRGWAEDIAKTVPAVSDAAEQVVKLAGQVRGWLPPGLG